jgi:hypothetical protein
VLAITVLLASGFAFARFIDAGQCRAASIPGFQEQRMLPPQTRKFDIVEQFSQDADGSRLREVVQHLRHGRQHYVTRIEQGDVGAELTAVVSAYDAALQALPGLWQRVRQETQNS